MTPRPALPIASTMLTRRRILAAGASGLAALAVGGRSAGARSLATARRLPMSSSPVTLDIAMGWIKNVEYAGSWLAIENGFYEAEGLEANYLQGGPNAPRRPLPSPPATG